MSTREYDHALFVQRLDEAIKRDGRSAAAISVAAGLGNSAIKHLRQYRPYGATAYTLFALAEQLNVSVDWLLGRDDNKRRLGA